MARDLDRRRNFLGRLKSAPVIAAGAASALGLVVYLAKPLTITVGDIMGPLVVLGPTIYQVRLAPPGAVDTLTATAVGTSSVTVGAPQEVIFHSDWSSCTGTTTQCLVDHTKAYPWDTPKGTIAGGKVVTDTVDWQGALPAGTNALTIVHVAGNDNPGVRLNPNSLPALSANDKRGFRFYIKVIFDDSLHAWGNPPGNDNSIHPFQDGIGGSNVNFEYDVVNCGSNEQWQAHFETVTAAGGFRGYTIDGVAHESCTGAAALPKDSVFRFEMLQTMHASGDSIDYEFKMYNSDGSVRVNSDRFIRYSGPGDSSDAVTWVDSPLGARWAQHRELQLGTNGWGQPPGVEAPAPYVVMHWGAVAICSDWCGAYPISGVEN